MPSGVYKRSEQTIEKMRQRMRGRWTGEKNPNWIGGRFIDKDGYILIRKLDHPFHNGIGYVREHRLEYEKHFKCIILPWIDVHHINGDKQDNRIENLQLYRHDEHTRLFHYRKHDKR